MIKYFRFSWDYVLWGIPWVNIMMLLATIPVYESDNDDEPKKEETAGDGIEVDTPDDLKAFLKM